jgi:arabinogalactan oligomer/maltooligosaccharide transport system permease protein
MAFSIFSSEKRGSIWHHKKAYLFILPSLALFFFFFLFPIIYSVYLSTTNASFFNLVRGPESIGLSNYTKLLFEGKFYHPLLITGLFMSTSVFLKVSVGLLLAAFFSSNIIKFKRILFPLILIPWAVPWFLSVSIWRGMFSQDFGVINQALQSIGLPAVNWLNNTWNAFIAYNMVEVWLVYPFMMSVLIAAMMSIPPDLYESALMDGASSWSKFKHVTLPLIKKPLLWATLMTTIASYMIFGVPFLLNRGGPAGSNEFLMVYGYNKAFFLGRYGFAAAFMVIVFAILTILVILYSKITKMTKEE